MTALASADVTVQTQGVSLQAVSPAISSSARLWHGIPSILSLQADRNIIIGESITANDDGRHCSDTPGRPAIIYSELIGRSGGTK